MRRVNWAYAKGNQSSVGRPKTASKRTLTPTVRCWGQNKRRLVVALRDICSLTHLIAAHR